MQVLKSFAGAAILEAVKRVRHCLGSRLQSSPRGMLARGFIGLVGGYWTRWFGDDGLGFWV